MADAQTLLGGFPAGLCWQGIAIDRSQAFGSSVNLNTISRGDGGGTTTTSRWSALQGAGSESAALANGVLCNKHTGVAWRALLYSLPLCGRTLATAIRSSGPATPQLDIVILTAQVCIGSSGGGQTDTGVFLMQWNGTVGSIVLPTAGSPNGLGFQVGLFGNTTRMGITAWTSSAGFGNSVAVGPLTGSPLNAGNAVVQLTITNPHSGLDGTYVMTVNGAFLQGGTFASAVGSPGANGYAAGQSAYVPIVSAGAGEELYVGDFTLLQGSPGYV